MRLVESLTLVMVSLPGVQVKHGIPIHSMIKEWMEASYGKSLMSVIRLIGPLEGQDILDGRSLKHVEETLLEMARVLVLGQGGPITAQVMK